MSPRKSSTSSDKPPSRPRYLGIEVAGVFPVNPRWLERELERRLRDTPPAPHGGVRLIRWADHRAVVEVDHRDVAVARVRWNADLPVAGGPAGHLATTRSWGTLWRAKRWLAAARA